MTQKLLPPQVRRRINKRAHELALAAELVFRDRLTAEAQTQTAFGAGLRALTDEDLAAMIWPKGELAAWFQARAWSK